MSLLSSRSGIDPAKIYHNQRTFSIFRAHVSVVDRYPTSKQIHASLLGDAGEHFDRRTLCQSFGILRKEIGTVGRVEAFLIIKLYIIFHEHISSFRFLSSGVNCPTILYRKHNDIGTILCSLENLIASALEICLLVARGSKLDQCQLEFRGRCKNGRGHVAYLSLKKAGEHEPYPVGINGLSFESALNAKSEQAAVLCYAVASKHFDKH